MNKERLELMDEPRDEIRDALQNASPEPTHGESPLASISATRVSSQAWLVWFRNGTARCGRRKPREQEREPMAEIKLARRA